MNTKFLLYYETNYLPQCNVYIKCKFAATIGDLRFAVFTRNKSKLRILFHRNGDNVCEMRIENDKSIKFDGPVIKHHIEYHCGEVLPW